MQVEKKFMSYMAAQMATVHHSYIMDYRGDELSFCQVGSDRFVFDRVCLQHRLHGEQDIP